ncbi:MAG: cyclic beta-1 2-glucan modification transmembrane [Planctomycetota bacterium]|nr:MAG: cyclic beta-1 2-glucan modification transmembrane [Planctomycetota bacterium]
MPDSSSSDPPILRGSAFEARIRGFVEACRKRPWVSRLAATVFLLSAAFSVQILSQPEGPRFREGLAVYATRFWPLLGSIAVLLAAWVALWAATHRARLAAMLLLVLCAPPAIANAAKLASLDLPLLPLDVYRIGDMMSVFHADFLRPGGWLKLALLFAFTLPMPMSILLLPAPKSRPRTRAVAGLAAVAFLGSLFLPATNVFAQLPGLFARTSWDSRGTHDQNGFVVFFAMNCRYVPVEAPPGYSEEAVARIIRELPPSTAKTSDLRPNVIVVLSESFSDVTRIPGVEFETDPLPTLHELQRDFGRLDLVSPVYAGITCNAELELLTGFSMRFFAEPSAAWVDSVRRPVPSLASILRGHGYRALSLHAVGGFHNDAQVQPLLGFERCIPGSEWVNRESLGWLVTDDAVTKEIVRVSRELPRPWFLCANTIEGHAPYDAKYPDPKCGIRFTRPLSEKARAILTGYAFGLSRADRALRSLIDAYRDSPEPTLIFFYGDHLPDLGDNFLAWRETGYLPPGEGSTCLEMRTVPAAIWNNYGKRLTACESPIGMSYVLPLLLDALELPKPAHVRLVENAGARSPVFSLADYRLMQYDLLFGRQHFLRDVR